MNERIRNLKDKIWADEYWTKPNTDRLLPAQLNRFAELIVRECARVAAQTVCPYQDEFAKQTYGHTWDMACVASAKDIRKYFGVEK